MNKDIRTNVIVKLKSDEPENINASHAAYGAPGQIDTTCGAEKINNVEQTYDGKKLVEHQSAGT